MWEELSKLFWMIGRRAELTQTPQIYCFSPILGVLSMFKVHNYRQIFVRHTTGVSIFLDVTHGQDCCYTDASSG